MAPTLVRLRTGVLLLLALAAGHCGVPERDNPLDPGGRPAASGDGSALVLRVPLSKSLAAVVDRVMATLEAPGLPPITRELSVSPLGPATGTLGVLTPGTNRTLTLAGFDVDGNLIFSGRREGITIATRETTRVEIQLELVSPPPDQGNAEGDADAPPEGSADAESAVGDSSGAGEQTQAAGG